MKRKQQIRIIKGIVLINVSIFLLSSIFLTENRSFSFETGNQVDYFFNWLLARSGWGECLMILLCSSIFSLGVYRICLKPLKITDVVSKDFEEKKTKAPYWS